MKIYKCRFCKKTLKHKFADLGISPIANDYIRPENAGIPDKLYPLCVYVCSNCFLVQIPNLIAREKIFNDQYAYFSSYSDSWLTHAKEYVEMISKKLSLNDKKTVVELASNDGYLLQYFKSKNIPVLGIDPSANVAAIAENRGIKTLIEFFGKTCAEKIVKKGIKADLIIANNVLAHVPDLNDFVSGIKQLLKNTGTATLEFPYLSQMIDNNEFDTIYHEHYSYFSLIAVNNIFSAHNLTVYEVEEIPTHGGSLRIYIRHSNNKRIKMHRSVFKMLKREINKGLNNIHFYSKFQMQVSVTKKNLMEFLSRAKKSGKTVAAYGAPAKGNTLLNYCGINSKIIDFTVDKSPYKQNHLLPGSRIPVYSPEKLAEINPDYILILPWNLKREIISQMKSYKNLTSKFIIPIPRVEISS